MKRMIVFLFLMASLAMMASPVKIGWGTRAFTPDFQVNIPGQNHKRPSEGARDPLMATALVFECNGNATLFLSVDFLGLSTEQMNRMVEAIKKEAPELPADHLIFNATHSHTSVSVSTTAPETSSTGKAWALMKNACVAALKEAWANRKEGMIARGQSDAYIGKQRRVVYKTPLALNAARGPFFSGYAAMYGKTDTPNFSHLEGAPSPEVNFLFTFDAQKKLTGVLINVPCPSQCTEGLYVFSADYWHDVREAIHKQYGKDVFVYSQCGAAGDLSPHEQVLKRARDRRFRLKYGVGEAREFERKEIAEQVLRAMNETLSWATNEMFTEPLMAFEAVTMKLPKLKLTEEQYKDVKAYIAGWKLKEPAPELDEKTKKRLVDNQNTHINRYIGAAKRYEEGYKNYEEEIEIYVAVVAGMAFVTCPYELYSTFLQQIQARSPFDQTVVVQLAGARKGQWTTYLSSRLANDNRGYGSCHFSNRIDPAGGDIFVDSSLKALQNIYDAQANKTSSAK